MKIEDYCTKIEKNMMQAREHRAKLLGQANFILSSAEECEGDDGELCFTIAAQTYHDLQEVVDKIEEEYAS